MTPAVSAHALAAVTTQEIESVRAILADAGRVGESTRFVYVGLEEPAHGDVTYDRRFRVLLHDVAGAPPLDIIVSVTRGVVDSVRELDQGVDGQLPVLDEEFELVEQRAGRPTTAGWPRSPRADSTSPTCGSRRCRPASSSTPSETGARMLRGLAFVQEHPEDHAWAHPIDGLVAYVDVVNRTVDQVIDLGRRADPRPESGNFDDPRRHRAAAHHPEAHRDHPARGAQLRPRRQPARLGEVVAAGRLRRPRGPGAAPDRLRRRRPCGRSSTGPRSPRWSCPTPTRRRCGRGRTTSTPASTWSGGYANSLELGCDCVGDITYSRRRHRRRARQPQALPQRRLHPRGGLRRSSGSTPTCGPAPRRPAASAAW